MNDRIKIIGGPMDGLQVGDWDEYPDRIILEYDCVRKPNTLALVTPDLPFVGADRLFAEYNFDRGWNAYSFGGWRVQRTPPRSACHR
jgi:hypothetical protein